MTRKIILATISKNVCWKETSKYLKHIKMENLWNLDEYNRYSWAIIALYRNTEVEIDNKNMRYTKFQYREKIKELIIKLEKDI